MGEKQHEQVRYYTDNENIKQKDNEVLSILERIIDGVENIDNFIEKFDRIYENEYRHKYSDILIFLMEKQPESLDYLVSNMNILREYILKESYKFQKSFLKLYDHVMLEITRIRLYNNYEERENLIEDRLNSTKNEFDYYIKSWDSLQKDIYNVNEQLKNTNAQFISILGIFSAIVMVFFGGLSIFGNVLSTMKSCSVIRVSFITSLIGDIVFNIIFLLLYFIAKILDKSIATNDFFNLYNQCYYWDERENEMKENSKAYKKYKRIMHSSFRRLKFRYPIVYWFNISMIIIMIISGILWIKRI